MIPGGTGFLGQALAARLVARGDDVVALCRTRRPVVPGSRSVVWDARTPGSWTAALEGADAVVHLTGRRVDVRPTRSNVDELISSRVGPVTLVGEAVRRCADPPRVWLQASSLAIFGDTGDAVLDETSPPSGIGPREMVTVCLAWEHAFELATRDVGRKVLLRMGIAIGGRDDPATTQLARLTRLGLGGTIGSGRQWVSWVGLDDLVRVMLAALDDEGMAGTYHVASPNPVTNAEMMATYRRLLAAPFGLPSPDLLVRLGAPLLGSSASLALTGRRAAPKRLLEHGFVFQQPTFEPALQSALSRSGLLGEPGLRRRRP